MASLASLTVQVTDLTTALAALDAKVSALGVPVAATVDLSPVLSAVTASTSTIVAEVDAKATAIIG